MSIDVKRHLDHENWYKGKHLIDSSLLAVLSSCAERPQHACYNKNSSSRHGAEEGPEIPPSRAARSRKLSGLIFWDLHVHPQWNPFSNQVTHSPSSSCLLIVPLSVAVIFTQTTTSIKIEFNSLVKIYSIHMIRVYENHASLLYFILE